MEDRTCSYVSVSVGPTAHRHCVRTVSHAPRNPGQTPSFTGTLGCISMLREVVDRECVGGIWCASARVSGINFQACSIDHSDISPFRINRLADGLEQCSAKRSFKSLSFCYAIWNHRFTDGWERQRRSNCVRPSNVTRSLTVIMCERRAAQGPGYFTLNTSTATRPRIQRAWRTSSGMNTRQGPSSAFSGLPFRRFATRMTRLEKLRSSSTNATTAL